MGSIVGVIKGDARFRLYSMCNPRICNRDRGQYRGQANSCAQASCRWLPS